ncbi:FAD-dependent oxidoreductase [Pseudenhygromyxa sp. WMMC2535]|uniref:hydroxysqualene dehydroxylase HpnE n=1 Tax=Pseudenhygromyxa sp. WMMC2535 TaxID=2712867 RepID=UPI00155338EC|nr:hydroxysqualene dehydroxylase HpnE [Pseudenhygromyxa sp. WMMC2535]NVB41708.1 FAD-dependent oxidoreductase [Pseudenhygromyxa sp. WMMC2535]
MTSSTPIVIIGGGFAGLAAAVRLVDSGRKVLVLEATKAGGGRSRSFHDKVTGREIDNGQHLMMGCYHETLSFLKAIGTPIDQAIHFQRNLGLTMIKPGGGRIELACPPLPAPLHLAAGLLGMRGLGVLHRTAALRAGLMLQGEIMRPDDNETCDAWLRRLGQTQAVRGAFWEPLIWAVLNDDPLVASAAMLLTVIERAFMSTRDASRLAIPRLPLSELYVDRSVALIRERGSEVRFASPARQIELDSDGRVSGVILKSGETIATTEVISAVPPHAMLELLPAPAREDLVFRDVARLESSPIVNLWVSLDRPILDRAFVGLIASPLHWLWDRDRVEAGVDAGSRAAPSRGPSLLSVTISGARSFVNDQPEALRELFVGELGRFFPQGPTPEILGFRVVKEKRATISHAAGTYRRRPETRSPIPGLLLAGDWVRTGLPATIESAVQSGHDAAAVLR